LSAAGLGSGQQSQKMKPNVSDQPFTTEELAVYQAMLSSWFQGEKAAVNLSFQTDAIDTDDPSFDKKCLKGLNLEKMPRAQVHRFRGEDITHLGSVSFRLVDPDQQTREVADNDPGKAIREGKPVDDAVSNGFAHGLMTLSEIQFDKDHEHAVVSFSFFCWRLCGHSTTMLMEKKKNGIWIRKSLCGGWVS